MLAVDWGYFFVLEDRCDGLGRGRRLRGVLEGFGVWGTDFGDGGGEGESFRTELT